MKKYFLLLFALIILFTSQAQSIVLLGYSDYDFDGIFDYTVGFSQVTDFFLIPGSTQFQPNLSDMTMVQGHNGKFYGLGYTSYNSYIYEYDYINSTYTVKATFNTTVGTGPQGGLIRATNGLYYGINSSDGLNGSGTLFSYNEGDTFITKLIDFPSGASPQGTLLQAMNGNLYGMTRYDGSVNSGTVFEYNIGSNAYNVLCTLPSGAHPISNLVEGGRDSLYGTTFSDGAFAGGTLFRCVVNGTVYDDLHDFPAGSNINGSGLISFSDGLIVGTTSGNSSSGVYGTLFSFNTRTAFVGAQYSTLHTFGTGTADGENPVAGFLQASDGYIYGVTLHGGYLGGGTIYRFGYGGGGYSTVAASIQNSVQNKTGHLVEFFSRPVSIQPSNDSVCPGSTASFLSHDTAVSYTTLWQVSTDGGSSYSNIPAATSITYSFAADASQNGYQYRAIFDHSGVYDTSTAATLLVYSPALDTITAFVCPGQNYIIGNDTFLAVGIYTDTLSGLAIHGCDSIVTLRLNIYAPDTTTTTVSACPGYNIASHTYYASGLYQDTLPGMGVYGCDSIIMLNLTILPTNSVTQNPTINQGQQYIVGADTLTTQGTYTTILTNSYGCDSTVITNLSVIDGIKSVGKYHFNLYPSPSAGLFTIDNDYPGDMTVHIINILGEGLKTFTMTGSQQTFDISDLAAGIYEVQISDEKQMLKVMKVVKE